MGYIIDFGHEDEKEPLNYILRLRGIPSSNTVVDLAGNASDINIRSGFVDENGYIHTNNQYITFRFEPYIDNNEDFTITTWFQDVNLPTGNSISSFNGAYSDTDHILFSSQMNMEASGISIGDTLGWGISYSSSLPYKSSFGVVSYAGYWPSISGLVDYDWIPSPDNMNHYAWCRKDNVIYCFFNGRLMNQYTFNNRFFRSGYKTIIIGTSDDNNGRFKGSRPCFNAVIKDFCVTKKALWTSDFTPPSNYLPNKW